MKRLLFVALMMTCSVSWAEWEFIGATDAGRLYVDKSTIRKNGVISRMWEMTDYSSVQTGASGYRYMSTKDYWAYNCREETIALIALIRHSEAMGGGNVVWSGTRQEREWEWQPVPPGTSAEATWKIVCGK